MISRIYNSQYAKFVAMTLAGCMMLMSFKMYDGKPQAVVLTAGTTIPLETVSMIQSDLVSPGQMVDFKVSYDVKVDEVVVIPAGSIARGQVTRADKAKAIGKEGFVEIQIKSVQAVDGQEIFLTGGNVYQEGDNKQTLSIVLGVLVCILFLLIKGKNAVVPAGYEVSSTVATNTTIET